MSELEEEQPVEWPMYWDQDDGYPNWFEDGMYYVSEVPDAWKTASANPKTQHWYEYDPGEPSNPMAMSGYNLSTDTSPVAGKTYYYLLEEGSTVSETANAYSTYQTYLMYRSSSAGSYAKVIDIKDYPDMVGDVRLVLG